MRDLERRPFPRGLNSPRGLCLGGLALSTLSPLFSPLSPRQNARQGQVLVLGRLCVRGAMAGEQDARPGGLHLPEPRPIRGGLCGGHEAGVSDWAGKAEHMRMLGEAWARTHGVVVDLHTCPILFLTHTMDRNGILCYRNGEKYEGSWKQDTAHGKGSLTYAGGDKYVGEWREGKKEGLGALHYVNGDVFKGEWRKDFACGHGVLAYMNGDVYEGEWLNDRRHGQGRFVCRQDGKTYVGGWREGRRHGGGVMTLGKDGKGEEEGGDVLRGQWEHGVLVNVVQFCFARDSPWNDPKY